MIVQLEEDGKTMVELHEIKRVIYNYYKQLFGRQPKRSVTLSMEAWGQDERLSGKDNEILMTLFSEEEVQRVIKDLKLNSAPGPDGFSSAFYKSC